MTGPGWGGLTPIFFIFFPFHPHALSFGPITRLVITNDSILPDFSFAPLFLRRPVLLLEPVAADSEAASPIPWGWRRRMPVSRGGWCHPAA